MSIATSMRVSFACCLSILILAGAQAMADDRLIDDFQTNPQGGWRFFTDTVMGGVSAGQVAFKMEGAFAYAHLTGEVSTANRGGFIQIRKQLAPKPPQGITGIRLIARGNNQRYFVHLRTGGTVLQWQYYQAGFDAGSQWREFRLPLAQFRRSGRMLAQTPSAASLRSVAIVAYGRDHTADIQVREIGYY